MADTGATNPGTMADDAAVGTLTWANPDNAKATNDAYATAGPVNEATRFTHYLKATNFGFSIPGGATIDGIYVEIEKKETGAAVRDWEVKLVLSNGSIGTENKAIGTNWPAEAYATYGGAEDLWSESWSDTDINDIDFGVVIEARLIDNFEQNTTAYVDHIRITVYYTENGNGAINPKVKVSGTFATKKTLVKIGGTFAEKPVKVKVSGTFQ